MQQENNPKEDQDQKKNDTHDKPDEFPMPKYIRGYVVQDEIGRGAFSTVYRVFCPKYCQTFVAKVLFIKGDHPQHYIVSFEAEIKALLLLNHPNVIRIYDFFREDNRLYLIFEDCPYGSLDDEICAHKKISPPRLYSFAKVLLEAINECHSNQIAHRDIKPANILLDKYNRPVIADFGLSEVLKSGEKLEKQAGSFAYKAPEIFKNEPYSPYKPDIWSLGVVFYEMATGTLPWKHCQTLQMLKKAIMTGDFEIPNEIDPEFGDVIKAMLDLNYRRRPSAQKLLDIPILANAESPGKKMHKLHKNNRSIKSHCLLPSPMRPQERYAKTSKNDFLKMNDSINKSQISMLSKAKKM
ncbi:CAMK family protein kinase [Tritrichomonas foetus]|uniref:CAMK family protein kinase n=1 Tax=Tritrichomonas foetus TaxID=1144522 RepID=A0A1J4KRV6_9EUKA|nr:CAMK family protein kinase [Tritrichomonas foetus]|eukprot:OHT12398.1 CAMK family protein kinase [Tritrichomonas foetus]